MKHIYSTALLVLIAFFTAPNLAIAGSWICEHNNLIREITVERESGVPAPCSVKYNKDAEGQGSKVLWDARNDGGYCDSKADQLAEKLKGFGWSCTVY